MPSGSEFERSKQLFAELGFALEWDAGDYIGFGRDGAHFILQKFDRKDFAEQFMISVNVNNAEEFWKDITDRNLAEKSGIHIGAPTEQPYGTEVNIIDLAGVCWHFVE